jgi:hypothetical protein
MKTLRIALAALTIGAGSLKAESYRDLVLQAKAHKEREEVRLVQENRRWWKEKIEEIGSMITDPIEDFIESVGDIRLRDWIFIILLLPVSLWAAKQVGLDKAAIKIATKVPRIIEENKKRTSLAKEAEFERRALAGELGPLAKATAEGKPITWDLIAEGNRFMRDTNPKGWKMAQEILRKDPRIDPRHYTA